MLGRRPNSFIRGCEKPRKAPFRSENSLVSQEYFVVANTSVGMWQKLVECRPPERDDRFFLGDGPAHRLAKEGGSAASGQQIGQFRNRSWNTTHNLVSPEPRKNYPMSASRNKRRESLGATVCGTERGWNYLKARRP